MIPIVPAFIPSSEADVKETLSRLGFANEIHLDVVDGQFDDNISWPYEPAGDPKAIKPHTDPYTLEVHLMVQDPLTAAGHWLAAGADMLLFHVESLSLEHFKEFEASTAVSVGICCYGDTTMDTLLEYAAYADYIQLMGIREIGAGGQPFDERVLEHIQIVKAAYPEKSITIDGHVGPDTIVQLRAAGADRFVANSALVGRPDPAAAQAALQQLVNQAQ